MSSYNDYYANLLNQYSPNQFQKTPQQIAYEQKVQAYQLFITTKEGVQALNEINQKFGAWFEQNYGIKQPVQSSEVSELKETIKKVATEITSLSFWDKTCDDKDCQYCSYRKLLKS